MANGQTRLELSKGKKAYDSFFGKGGKVNTPRKIVKPASIKKKKIGAAD